MSKENLLPVEKILNYSLGLEIGKLSRQLLF